MGAVGTALLGELPDEHPAPQVGAGGDDGGPDPVPPAHGGGDGGDPAVFVHLDGGDLPLAEEEAGGGLHLLLHVAVVGGAVGLDPEAVDGGAFALVEHPALEHGGVGGPGHLAAQGVQFPDQVALGGAADGGVAGHVGDGVQGDGEEDDGAAQAGGGKGGLDAGVAGADDGDIVIPCGVRLQSKHLRCE